VISAPGPIRQSPDPSLGIRAVFRIHVTLHKLQPLTDGAIRMQDSDSAVLVLRDQGTIRQYGQARNWSRASQQSAGVIPGGYRRSVSCHPTGSRRGSCAHVCWRRHDGDSTFRGHINDSSSCSCNLSSEGAENGTYRTNFAEP
jgi:hypothetical protein